MAKRWDTERFGPPEGFVMMQQYWWAFAAVGALLIAAGGIFVEVARELRSAPAQAVVSAPDLDPEPERLLRRLYELQARLDYYKLIVRHDGMLYPIDAGGPATGVNLIKDMFGPNTDPQDARAQRAFEKLVLGVPVTYLHSIPESLWDVRYVLTVTAEGKQYLRAKR